MDSARCLENNSNIPDLQSLLTDIFMFRLKPELQTQEEKANNDPSTNLYQLYLDY